MKKYYSLIKSSLQVSIAYPVTTLIYILISFITFILMFELWQTVFKSHATIAGYTWSEMLAYLLIAFIINTDAVNSEHRCARRIIDGSISMILLKPVKYDRYTFAEIAGSLIFSIGINISIGVVICFFFNVYRPNDMITITLFMVSLVNAVIIKYMIVYSASLLSFWTHNVHGVLWARVAIVSFFSGSLIPLNFFPNWLQQLANILPFQAIVNIPAQIFLKYNHVEMLWGIIIQWLWIVVFWYLAKVVLKFGLNKVEINGG